MPIEKTSGNTEYTVPAEKFGKHLSDLPDCRAYRMSNECAVEAEASRRIPSVDPAYQFNRSYFMSLAAWWNFATDEPLYISGPAGAGKTSSVLQWCAVVGQPVVSVTVRPNMEKNELLGRWVANDKGGMNWVDGPATLCWRHGWLLLINEFSAVPPEMWVSANDILEGAPLEIDATGERVDRHPLTRVVVTDNARGHASEREAGYFGRSVMDLSVVDRFWHIRLKGLTIAEEAALLWKRVPDDLRSRLPEKEAMNVLTGLADIAAASRKSSEQKMVGFDNRNHPLSHRALKRMSTMLLRYAAGDVVIDRPVIEWAVETGIANALDAVPRSALVTLVGTRLGTLAETLKRETARLSASSRRACARSVSADPSLSKDGSPEGGKSGSRSGALF